jgi:uncharacterized membrane protein YdjX (TVP38/TMEM64 family)
MADWYATRRPNMSAKVVIALMLLALALVAAVPVALVVGVFMMLFGHIIGGLALFGGSILAATGAVLLAGLTGLRHLRSMLTERNFRVFQLSSDDYTYIRDDYTSIR